MKPISQLHKDFDKAVKQFENANLARVVGIEAVKDMQKNIKDQSFNGGSTYTERSEATNKIYDNRGVKKNLKGSVYSSGKPLLYQTGNMYNSIFWEQLSKNSVFIGLDKDKFPGAQLLNEGGTGSMFGKHASHFPERKFIGWTNRMRDAIMKKFKYESDKAFHNFK
jgi:hypothetical protein